MKNILRRLPAALPGVMAGWFFFSAAQAAGECEIQPLDADDTAKNTTQTNDNFTCLDSKLSRLLALLEKETTEATPSEANDTAQHTKALEGLTFSMAFANARVNGNAGQVATEWLVRNDNAQGHYIMVGIHESGIRVRGEARKRRTLFETIASCQHVSNCKNREKSYWTYLGPGDALEFSVYTDQGKPFRAETINITVFLKLMIRPDDPAWTDKQLKVRNLSFQDIEIPL